MNTVFDRIKGGDVSCKSPLFSVYQASRIPILPIIEKLRTFVDRFIIGSMQYCDVPRRFYADRLPQLIAWLDENKINYYLKKELESYLLPRMQTLTRTLGGS